jgi:hypothetical protein
MDSKKSSVLIDQTSRLDAGITSFPIDQGRRREPKIPGIPAAATNPGTRQIKNQLGLNRTIQLGDPRTESIRRLAM